ncbi:MAG: adaptor protein MecA [Eubacteriales bacterium]
MEIIKIGDDALKIMLDAEEALTYGLDSEDIYGDDEETLKIFQKIFDVAKEKIGLEFGSGRVLVQMYQSKDGGCEIFISRLEVGSTYKDRVIPVENKRSKGAISPSLYRFENLENLLSVSARMENIGYTGRSSVYHDSKKGEYYLVLDDIYPKELKYAFIAEYAKQMKSGAIAYIKEHCECICRKNGVKILSKLL